MASISSRKLKSGSIRYKAEIRINRTGFPEFYETRTFSLKSLATEWAKKREAEIERDPAILNGITTPNALSLSQAFKKYIDEVKAEFARSKISGLQNIGLWPLGKKDIHTLTRKDFSEHIIARRKGNDDLGFKPIAASTALQELYYTRAVLKHAALIWNLDLQSVIFELDQAREGLLKSRLISKSATRRRLPSADELQRLTTYFLARMDRKNSTYPMHLVLWNAIYLCRRQAELCRMKLDDIDFINNQSRIESVKSPDGSKGNHKISRLPEISIELVHDTIAARKEMFNGKIDDGRYIPLDAKSVCTYFIHACKILDIKDLRFHDLRHEGATRLAENGYSIPQIQQVTLHDSWQSLQVYVDVTPRGQRLDYLDAMRIARAQLEPLV
jgi:integrase